MSVTLELIDAISTGDAVATENAFSAAMAEKIAGRLDDMRLNVSQKMFNPTEASEPTTTEE